MMNNLYQLRKIAIDNRLIQLYKMANLGNNFYTELVKMSSELNMNPEDVLLIMTSESGLNPSAGNPNGGAVGLIQFMPNTLKDKSIGYQGSSSDFGKMQGVEQLPYIKNLIKANSKNLGRPFDSAALFYVGNFIPAALNLPGIKNKDPNYAFVEKNPEEINGYSKKYLDVGIKIPIATESNWYNQNSIFDQNKKGSITYGDMIKKVDKTRNNKIYQDALKAMHAETGYQPQSKNIVYNEDSFDNVLNNLLNNLT